MFITEPFIKDIHTRLDKYRKNYPNWKFHCLQCVNSELTDRLNRLKNLPQNSKPQDMSTDELDKMISTLSSIIAISIKAYCELYEMK